MSHDRPTQLTVAVAQPLVVPGDVQTNVERMRPLIAEAAQRGAELVLFSECGLTGYDLDNRGVDARIAADDPALDTVAAMAAEHQLAIVTGFHERAGETIYNSAVAIRPDGTRVYQRKHNVIEHEAEHTPVQSAERQRVPFEWRGMRMAMLICADNGIPGIYEELAEAGFDMILLLSAGAGRMSGGFRQADLASPEKRRAYLDAAESVCFPRMEKTIRLGLAFASANQAGYIPETDFFHPGHSLVISSNGRLDAVIPGRFVFEHLRPEVAVGTVTACTPIHAATAVDANGG